MEILFSDYWGLEKAGLLTAAAPLKNANSRSSPGGPCYNTGTWEAETGGYHETQGQPGLQSLTPSKKIKNFKL